MYDDRELDGEFRKRSAWLLPLSVVSVVFLLSAGVLLSYFSPTGPSLFHEQVSPTSGGDRVALSLNGRKFNIPANYLMYERARKGGSVRQIAMFARLPKLQGWSNWQSDDFKDGSADSKIIYLTLRIDRNNLTEADRLKRVYGDYILPAPHPGPYGLHRYDYRRNSGYGDEDFFVGQTPAGPIVLRCDKLSQNVPAPNCLREQHLEPGVILTWRFRRTQLSHWKRIDENVDKLMAAFRIP